MPRTTLQLEDDALRAAKAYAARHRTTLGQALSALVRLGVERPVVTVERNGFHVLRLNGHSPRVTAARVGKLFDEQP